MAGKRMTASATTHRLVPPGGSRLSGTPDLSKRGSQKGQSRVEAVPGACLHVCTLGDVEVQGPRRVGEGKGEK